MNETTGEDTATVRMVGSWKKVAGEDCARPYPDRITFFAAWIYSCPTDEKEFRFWQGGDYELAGDGRIRIQMANDAMAPYDIDDTVDGQLTFTDDQGCRFTYERLE